jgi:hypothetical protein
MAEDRFYRHPWLGGGAGYAYEEGLYTLDTPWMVPAKLGVVGTGILLLNLAAIVSCIRNLRRLTGYATVHTWLRGWALVLVGATPFGPWVEDKGFGLSLALGLAAAFSAASHKTPITPNVELPSTVEVSVPRAEGMDAVVAISGETSKAASPGRD